MNVIDALKKLGLIDITESDDFIYGSLHIQKEELQDNLDLLAKELHMQVEYEALTVKHKLGRERHKEIYVKDIDFLEE